MSDEFAPWSSDKKLLEKINTKVDRADIEKIKDEIKGSVEDDFNDDKSEQTFFINIEFRKAPYLPKEVGRLSMPQLDPVEMKKYLSQSIKLLTNALEKYDS